MCSLKLNGASCLVFSAASSECSSGVFEVRRTGGFSFLAVEFIESVQNKFLLCLVRSCR